MRKEGRRGRRRTKKKRKKVEEGRMESERGGGMEEGEGIYLVCASQKGGHDVSSRLFEVVPVSL